MVHAKTYAPMSTSPTPRTYKRNNGTLLLMANGYALSDVARSLRISPSTLHGYLSGARVMPDDVYAYLESILPEGADTMGEIPEIRRRAKPGDVAA